MTTVQLQKIDQAFDGRCVLKDLDLFVESGKYLVLLGHSGCGKTTVLRLLAGLQFPDSGEVFLGGRPMRRVSPRNRDVSMVFQHDSLYPHLTVGDSIRFALRDKLSRSEIEARVSEAACLTHIESMLDRYPHRLSGGELRRAAIAKAVARRSGVRLLDEPLSALDASARQSLQRDLLAWHQAAGGTTIHVTHDGQEAMRMADTIGVLHEGRIAQLASPAEIYARPQSIAVARSIGWPTMEFFPATARGGRIQMDHPDVRCDSKIAPSDGDCTIGVRPEAFSLAAAPSNAESSQREGLHVRGRLTRTQRVQCDLHHMVQLGERMMMAVESSDGSASPDAVGKEVVVLAPSQSLHFFDAATGHRLEGVVGG